MTPVFRYSALSDVEIIDGDSVRVDIDLGFNMTLHKVNVRLARHDAPETRHKKKLHKTAGLAVEEVVKLWFELATLPGAVLTLVSNDIEDLYGRVIGDFEITYQLAGEDIASSLSSFLKSWSLVQQLDDKGKRRGWTDEQLEGALSNAKSAAVDLNAQLKVGRE